MAGTRAAPELPEPPPEPIDPPEMPEQPPGAREPNLGAEGGVLGKSTST